MSSLLNQKTNRPSSFCALYTNALTIKCTYNHTPFKEEIKKKKKVVNPGTDEKAFSNSLPVDILACMFGSAGTADSPNPADFLPEGLSHCRHCCYCLVPGDKKNRYPPSHQIIVLLLRGVTVLGPVPLPCLLKWI